MIFSEDIGYFTSIQTGREVTSIFNFGLVNTPRNIFHSYRAVHDVERIKCDFNFDFRSMERRVL